MKDLAICVCGGTGSFGSALVRKLLTLEPRRVIVFSRGEHRQAEFRRELGDDPRVRWFIGDVRDEERLCEVVHGCDIVVNCAAIKRIEVAARHAEEAIKTNVTGHGNVLRAAMAEGVGRVLLISSDKACVVGSAPVRMLDGNTLPLRAIVDYRLDVPVATLGHEGPTTGPVSGWYRNPLGGRRLVTVNYEGAAWTGATVTADHRILTSKGWKEAGELTDLDWLVTSEWAPNRHQEAVIVGTMLGDSSIFTRHKGPSARARPYFRMGQALDQIEWLDLKTSALRGMAGVKSKRNGRGRSRSRGDGKHQPFCWSAAAPGAYWSQLHHLFYVNRKKIVPRELVRRAMALAPRLFLATWFCDDGCRVKSAAPRHRDSARIATHAFSADDVRWLAEELTVYGLPSSAYRMRGGQAGYSELRFGVEAASVLFDLIGPFVPPCLRHKLPATAPPFDPQRWELGQHEQWLGRARIKSGRPRGADYPVYCIDVPDTQNFTVNGLVLHNCAPAVCYGATKLMAEHLTVAWNVLSFPRGLRASAVRWGNVLGSAGSVVPLFAEAIRRKLPVPITDPEMTRFWIRMDEAVAFCLEALRDMRGGEIFVPMLKAASIYDLYVAMRGADTSIPWMEVGARDGGEKKHEALVSEPEAARTVGARGGFVIEPLWEMPKERAKWEGWPLTRAVTSDLAGRWSLEDLRRAVRSSG